MKRRVDGGMCQTGCGEARLTVTSTGVTFNEITSKYSKKGSMSKAGIELFHCICEICCKMKQYNL